MISSSDIVDVLFIGDPHFQVNNIPEVDIFIDKMLNYTHANAPLTKDLEAEEVGHAAAFLLSPLASAITASILYVDNGINAMGIAMDSPAFKD